MSNTNEETALEVVPPSALQVIQSAEISQQITTAKQYPRSMATFKRRAVDMATIDVETAESCIYVRPVGKGPGGKQQFAEGLSVRMAEIVGASYGNLRVGAMIVEQTDRYVITRGFAHDLESNFASTSECKEATVTKDGRPFSEGMRAVIAKAALSKARRDATFQVVPKALCRPIEAAARALIAGDSKSMDARRANAEQFVQRLKIDPARVWAALGVKGADDLTSEILMTLAGIRTAIQDGDTTIDDAFPPIMSSGKIGQPAANPLTDATAANYTPPKVEDVDKRLKRLRDVRVNLRGGGFTEEEIEQMIAELGPDGDPDKLFGRKKQKGTSADDLRAHLLEKAKQHNIGKPMVEAYFNGEEVKALNGGRDFYGLTAGELSGYIAEWDETKEAILNA